MVVYEGWIYRAGEGVGFGVWCVGCRWMYGVGYGGYGVVVYVGWVYGMGEGRELCLGCMWVERYDSESIFQLRHSFQGTFITVVGVQSVEAIKLFLWRGEMPYFRTYHISAKMKFLYFRERYIRSLKSRIFLAFRTSLQKNFNNFFIKNFFIPTLCCSRCIIRIFTFP
jgi:hypothetical protein